MKRHDSRPSRLQRLPGGYVAAGIAMLLCLTAGCSREFWRDQADRDSYEVIDQKNNDMRWALPRIDVQPDPRSRFFDPYDPDFSPLPPDDEAANALMHEVAGIKGYKSWHKFGEAFSVENPQWLENLKEQAGPNDRVVNFGALGTFEHQAALKDLTLPQLLELFNIHSRDYQFNIENVYLQALAVTLQRFQFAVQYAGPAGVPGFGFTRSDRPKGTNSAGFTPGFGFRQFLPTGGQWVAEMTNNTLWLFSKGNSATASALSFSLTQPLLRNAGRKVILENLTQQERSLLYSIRTLARLRKTYFTQVVAGNYLGLLLQHQTIYNQISNIARYEEQIKIQTALASQQPRKLIQPLPALPPGVVLPKTGAAPNDPAWQNVPEILRGSVFFEVDPLLGGGNLIWIGDLSEDQAGVLLGMSDDDDWQAAAAAIVQTRLSTAVPLSLIQILNQVPTLQNQLRSQQQSLQSSYDSFKIFLGLPTDLKLSVDTSPLKQFELIDPRMYELEHKVDAFVLRWSELDPEEKREEPLTANDYIARLDELLQLQADVVEIGLGSVQRDFDKLDSIKSERLSTVDEVDRARFEHDVERDRNQFRDATASINAIKTRIERLKQALQTQGPSDALINRVWTEGRRARDDLLQISRSLQVIQVGQRVESVLLLPFGMSYNQVVQMAIENRLDLMTQRAMVMDARRKIEVAANQLQSVLSLTGSGSIGTKPGKQNPVDFRKDNSNLQLGIEFDTPLNLVQQRNTYRQALITYQRAKRTYMQTEDQIKQQVRREWRLLETGKRNFETTRQQVRIAAIQLDNTIEQASAPAAAGGGGGGGNQNTGLNLLNALKSVLAAQNSFIGFWISYEESRIAIYQDMGIMEIDANGVWKDEYYQNLARNNGLNTEEPPQKPPNPRPEPLTAETSGPNGISEADSIRYSENPTALESRLQQLPRDSELPLIVPNKTLNVNTSSLPRNGRPGAEFVLPLIPSEEERKGLRDEHRNASQTAEQSDWKLPVVR